VPAAAPVADPAPADPPADGAPAGGYEAPAPDPAEVAQP
ncbi:MAG: hypothetical protein QOF29_1287, partial [bacterium]